jgi:hypothetical protein
MLVHGGVTADIRVKTYQEFGVISIDRKNLVTESGTPYVYVAVDGTAHRRKVSLRDTGGLEVLIEDGLAEGDQLIVEGQIHLSDGAKIRVVNGGHADDATTGEQGA